MYNIFTVSRQDVYDYLRCPKIVSIKTHRNLIKPKTVREKLSERNIRHEVGTLGEILTKKMFSGGPESKILSIIADKFEEETGEEADDEGDSSYSMDEEDISYSKPEYSLDSIFERPVMPGIKLDLESKGVLLDSHMTQILKATISGLGKIKKFLNEKYGELEIIGHGESRNGVLPNKVRPDFVAILENQKPVLIEVKNTAVANQKADNFQASFYNTIAKKYGAIVLEERTESGKSTVVPRALTDTVCETILVYPRKGKAESITKTINLDENLIKEIWLAKQLGLKGKSPKTDCDSRCPHHRLGDLPEDNFEPAIPLALIYSEGLVEQNADLDTTYLRNFLWRTGIGRLIQNGLWDVHHAEFLTQLGMTNKSTLQKELESISKKRDKFLDDIAEKTGFSRQEINKITSTEAARSYTEEIKKLEKEMTNELNPWKKLLGEKKFDSLRNTAKGQSTKLYPLPKKSDEFIRKSWKAWN